MEANKKSVQEVSKEESTCPECGVKFHCSTSGKCWCSSYDILDEELARIREKYDSCLCPDCLKKRIK